jgi:hypothetical protein
MEKSDDIMTDIHQYLQELDHPLKEATYGETFDICDLIKRLLRLLDILFSILRKNHDEVTAEDHVIRNDGRAGSVALAEDLNYTPSFHYLHKEAPRLLKLHGGFGEMTEDHLEQNHQNMDKIHRRLGTSALCETSNGNLSIGKDGKISTAREDSLSQS